MSYEIDYKRFNLLAFLYGIDPSGRLYQRCYEKLNNKAFDCWVILSTNVCLNISIISGISIEDAILIRRFLPAPPPLKHEMDTLPLNEVYVRAKCRERYLNAYFKILHKERFYKENNYSFHTHTSRSKNDTWMTRRRAKRNH